MWSHPLGCRPERSVPWLQARHEAREASESLDAAKTEHDAKVASLLAEMDTAVQKHKAEMAVALEGKEMAEAQLQSVEAKLAKSFRVYVRAGAATALGTAAAVRGQKLHAAGQGTPQEVETPRPSGEGGLADGSSSRSSGSGSSSPALRETQQELDDDELADMIEDWLLHG